MALLEVKNLEVYYGVIQAIKGISFEVNKGEIVTLIGANGAGKCYNFSLVNLKGYVLYCLNNTVVHIKIFYFQKCHIISSLVTDIRLNNLRVVKRLFRCTLSKNCTEVKNCNSVAKT